MNLLNLIKDNLDKSDPKKEFNSIHTSFPFYCINSKNESLDFSSFDTQENESYNPCEVGINNILNFTENLLNRIDLTTLSFEDELVLYMHNINCIKVEDRSKDYYLKTYVLSLIYFFLGEYSHARVLYKKIKIGFLDGDTYQSSFQILGILLKHHESCSEHNSFEEVALLLSRKLEVFSDGVEQYHIDTSIRNYTNINVTLSHFKEYGLFMNEMKNKKVIFLVSHGDEKDGLVYYNCLNKKKKHIKACDISKYFENAQFVFLLGCTRKPYLCLKERFDFFSIPKTPSGSFEYSEMFIKSFMKTYKVNKEIEPAILSGELSGQIFSKKTFSFDISRNRLN